MKFKDQLQSFLACVDSPIVDLRPTEEFAGAHMQNAANLPAEQLFDRLHELPTTRQSLRLVDSQFRCEQIIQQLNSKGYRVAATLNWDNAIAEALSSLNFLEQGENSMRLWQPAPMVARFIVDNPLKGEQKTALDIGCGAGRDAVFLALNGWQVSAIDYLPNTLNKLQSFANYYRISIISHQLDLEAEARALDQIEGKFDLILVVRYLHRPLLHQIRDKINPGGFILYQTFMEGCEKFGKPKNPRFMLKAGELSRIFQQYRILVDEVEYLDDGRPTNVFIAQRPG